MRASPRFVVPLALCILGASCVVAAWQIRAATASAVSVDPPAVGDAVRPAGMGPPNTAPRLRLPLPAGHPLITIDLRRLRGTKLFGRHQAAIDAAVRKRLGKSRPLALLTQCGLDPLYDLDRVRVTFGPGKASAVVAEGRFHAGLLQVCLTRGLGARAALVVAHEPGGIVVATGELRPLVGEVLRGARASAETSPLFRHHSARPGAILSATVPSLAGVGGKTGMPGGPNPFRGARSLVAQLSLPEGGIDLRIALRLADAGKASQLAALWPLAGIAAPRGDPVMRFLLRHGSLDAEGATLRFRLEASRAEMKPAERALASLLRKL